MPTPEEKYYDSMNTLLAPVRWVKSLMQTVIIILLLIGAGLLYPLIQLVNEGHVTFGGFVVSFLTALFILTFFFAPWYTVCGGILCFVVFYACCFSESFVDSLTGTAFFFSSSPFSLLASCNDISATDCLTRRKRRSQNSQSKRLSKSRDARRCKAAEILAEIVQTG